MDFIIIILLEDNIGLLIRIIIILNRKNLKINYMNISKKKYKKFYINQYILNLECKIEDLIKLKKTISNLIGVHNIFYKKI
ncbi:acetolactate synthase [Blattabacterium cuenoti]|uniref:acetolactate synthase n=1 Tax=Blattabacterium cuenoti TaxID=1653831 RepID=UPI00163CBDEB|nr:acetolactate synthase [Blattabacterium cuenoti]